jgi:hypothetical protein
MQPKEARPGGGLTLGDARESWSAIAGIGFIAMGVFYSALDLPAAISWAPWGCIVGGATLVAAAVSRSRIS